MTETTKTILIAGATGYLGRHLVQEYAAKSGWRIKALVRRKVDFSHDVELVMAEATTPESLKRIMDGVDLVVSALGITRQQDGLTYQQVFPDWYWYGNAGGEAWRPSPQGVFLQYCKEQQRCRLRSCQDNTIDRTISSNTIMILFSL